MGLVPMPRPRSSRRTPTTTRFRLGRSWRPTTTSPPVPAPARTAPCSTPTSSRPTTRASWPVSRSPPSPWTCPSTTARPTTPCSRAWGTWRAPRCRSGERGPARSSRGTAAWPRPPCSPTWTRSRPVTASSSRSSERSSPTGSPAPRSSSPRRPRPCASRRARTCSPW